MDQTWADFPVVELRPPSTTHWQFPDAAWFAIFMWAAGPNRVVATKDQTTREPVRHVHANPDGSLVHRDVPFTSSDQSDVDDDLDEVLGHVGLPPRPRGFDWYLRIDSNQLERISRIGGRVEASIPKDIDGRDYLPAVRVAMEAMVAAGLEGSSSN
jgi:hypothetical protein